MNQTQLPNSGYLTDRLGNVHSISTANSVSAGELIWLVLPTDDRVGQIRQVGSDSVCLLLTSYVSP